MSNKLNQYAETFRRLYNKASLGFGESGRLMEAALRLADAYLTEQAVFTDDQCFALNAAQHDHSHHPYTCGNDSRHRPLIATRQGWRCADCDYRQGWAHGINQPTSG